MPTIKINDVEFYYELHGKGEPLVLVSGYTGDHCFWLPILPQLAQHFQVLVFDNRAVGQTKDPGKFPLTVELMADDVMSLVDALGLKKPHIIGQSMGSTITQNIAARYPDKINKVGLLNSTAKWRQAMLRTLKSMLLLRKENASFDCLFDAILGCVFGEKFLQNPENVETLRSIFLNDPYPQSVDDQERQYAALEQFDGRAALSKITAPTLVVAGLQDTLSLASESQIFLKNIVNVKLVEFDCAHGLVAEMPEDLLAELIKFFKS